jgi:hypothetical protein
MKKVEKGKKKLEVKKEKVRPLSDEDLDNVAGGAAGGGTRPPPPPGCPGVFIPTRDCRRIT